MPRVSQEHLDARRRQILDAARRRFTANGFHATSMQDILGESGLSAGAVYRYFRGKEDIIGAIAEEAVSGIRSVFDGDDDVPLDALIERAMEAVDERVTRDGFGRLALQVWAEAGRSEPLRERIASVVQEARAALRDRIARRYGDEVDADAVATLITTLLPGYLHARVIVGDPDPAAYRAGLDALVQLIATAERRA